MTLEGNMEANLRTHYAVGLSIRPLEPHVKDYFLIIGILFHIPVQPINPMLTIYSKNTHRRAMILSQGEGVSPIRF